MMKFALAILLGLFVGIWEVAVRPAFPSGFEFPMLLPIAVLVVITSRPFRALLVVVTATIIMSAYQLFTFDLLIFRWIAIVLIIISLSKYWLTNRSVYSSIALGFLAQLLDWGSRYLVSRAGTLVTDFTRGWTPEYIWSMTLFWDALFIAIGFFILARMSGRFQLSVQQSGAGYNVF